MNLKCDILVAKRVCCKCNLYRYVAAGTHVGTHALVAAITASPPASPPPAMRKNRRRASSSASVSGPLSTAAASLLHRNASASSLGALDSSVAGTPHDSDGEDVGVNSEDDDDENDEAMIVDPGMLPKELSTHWTGFFNEIFVFRNTVMPSLVPQIILAFFLAFFAQIVKMVVCSKDVVAAAECETTFDITGHQVVSVSLGKEAQALSILTHSLELKVITMAPSSFPSLCFGYFFWFFPKYLFF
jgi:hypothetical protein